MTIRGRTIAVALVASLATSATCSQIVPVPEGPDHTEGTGTVTIGDGRLHGPPSSA